MSKLAKGADTGGHVIGTCQWAAPEVFLGAQHTTACDAWSFGAVTWEMITKRCPFGRADPVQLVQHIHPPRSIVVMLLIPPHHCCHRRSPLPTRTSAWPSRRNVRHALPCWCANAWQPTQQSGPTLETLSTSSPSSSSMAAQGRHRARRRTLPPLLSAASRCSPSPAQNSDGNQAPRTGRGHLCPACSTCNACQARPSCRASLHEQQQHPTTAAALPPSP